MTHTTTWKPEYTVYKRNDSGAYGVRFSLKGKQYRLGLGKVSEQEANYLAHSKFVETKTLVERNLLSHDAGFETIALDYVETQFKLAEKNPKRLGHARHAQSTVKRYFIKCFKNQPITEIGYADLLDYLDWRKVYWTEGEGKDTKFVRHKRGTSEFNLKVQHKEASPSTLKREASFLRAIFKHAVRKRIMKQGDIPKLELPKVPNTKRASFTKEEYSKLLSVSERRIAEVIGNSKLMYERFLLHNFIVVAAETGMRPSELFNLNWGHVEGLEDAIKEPMKSRNITIFAQGKGKGPQRLVPKRSAISGFENLRNACETQFGSLPCADDPVFRNFYGKRLGCLNSSLNQLLDAAGLTYNGVGAKRSTYSFRHSYATWQLQKKPPVDIYTLAINMRTRVEMIELWYSDVIPTDRAEILRGDDEWE